MSLWTQFQQHEGRGVQKWSSYFVPYETHIGRYRNRPVRLLEIGVNRGGSLQMWKRYLGPDATIIGIDVNERCKEAEEPQIHVRIGSQADPAFLESVAAEFGPFDVIIDDGSHVSSHQIASMTCLYARHVAPTGVYMVEDINTSYVGRYEGGYKKPGTFIEHIKNLVDELHALSGSGVKQTEFTHTTMSMHIYDCLVAFEKGPHRRPVSIDMGEPKLVPKSERKKAVR